MNATKTKASTKTKVAKTTTKGAPNTKPRKADVAAPKPARTKKASEPKSPRVTKERRVVEALSRSEGATVLEMMEMTGWQEHSVRGFISGAVKKKLGLTVERITEDGRTSYRIPSVPSKG